MRRIYIARLFFIAPFLCIGFLVLSAPAYEADRLRPSFFQGKLSVAPVPSVGVQATMALELTAIAGKCKDASIQFKVPTGIILLESEIFPRQSFTKNIPKQYNIDIAVVEKGSYTLQATVYFQLSDGQRRAEHFFAYLLVGESYSQVNNDAPFYPATQSSPKNMLAPRAFIQNPTDGTISVSGYITYYNDNLSLKTPIRRIAVEALETNKKGSEVINSTYTDDDGFYSLPNINLDDPEDNTTRDIRLRVLFQNDAVRIADKEDKTHTFETFTVYNIWNGEVKIDYSLDSKNQYRGLGHIHNCIMDTYDFLMDRVNWSREQITVKWPCGNYPAYEYSYYIFGGKVYDEHINIPAGREWQRGVMLHEYGHSIMTGVYGYNDYMLPWSTYQDKHYIHTASDPGFALKEGWAEFFEALIDDNAYNLRAYPNSNTPNIEFNDWWTGEPNGNGSNTRGEVVEGAIASIFWDIADTAYSNDGSPNIDDDGMDGMFEKLWERMMKSRPGNIQRFWEDWVEDSYDQASSLYSIFADHGIEVAPPPGMDITAPVITSGPSISDLLHSSTSIIWSTDEESNSVVEYGTTLEYGHIVGEEANVTQHSMAIDSLLPGTMHYYRVSSTDANGNTVYSKSRTFNTPVLENMDPPNSKGDVNGDGRILANDAIMTLRIAADIIKPTDYQNWAADMNEDDIIRTDDAVIIIQKITGLAAPGVRPDLSNNKLITIVLSEAHGVAGGCIAVPLMLENISGLAGGNISLCYDQAVLRVLNISAASDVMLAANIAEPGAVDIAFASADMPNGRAMAEIHFLILADAPSPLLIKASELYGSDASPLICRNMDSKFVSWAIQPERSMLMQNFPNPFNPETWIPYRLAQSGEVTIRIYNSIGQLVRMLDLGYKSAGFYTDQSRAAYWDGKNEYGEEVSSGTFFYSIKADDFFSVRKLAVWR